MGQHLKHRETTRRKVLETWYQNKLQVQQPGCLFVCSFVLTKNTNQTELVEISHRPLLDSGLSDFYLTDFPFLSSAKLTQSERPL